MTTKMWVLLVALTALCACHKTPPEAAATVPGKSTGASPAAESKDNDNGKDAGEGLNLTAAQVEKIGLQTAALKTVDYAEETAGYGAVIPHEAIAQAVADLSTAQAAEKQSRGALARTQRLSGTPGAMSADVEDANARQLAVDTAALNLAKQRLSASFGQKPPWGGGDDSGLLHALADGSKLLVRVTFPLGALPGAVPKTLSASRLGADSSAKRWKLTSIWAAPADATVPGRSFFSVLNTGELGEGERIIAWAPIGAPQPGVLVPAEAMVISEGKYWCYIEAKPGSFVKTQIDIGKPFETGYVVTQGVKAGDRVVTRGASQLLAQESNSGADAD